MRLVFRLSLLLILALLLVGTATAQARGPFLTGIQSDNLALDAKPQQRELFASMLPPITPQIVRTTVRWNEIARNCGGEEPAALRDPANPCYDWQVIDETVRGSRVAGAQVVGSISRVPTWVNNNADYRHTGVTWTQFQRTLVHYEAFCHAVARHFASDPLRVGYWTVWNEPNSRTFFRPFDGSQYKRYAHLTVRCATALKHGAPGVLVAAGPTGPSSYPVRPVTFIRGVQPWLRRLGGRAVLDAWAHNPYTGAPVSPRARVFKPPRVGIGNVRDLFRVLDENPSTRGLPVWATEFSHVATRREPVAGVGFPNQATWLAEAQDVLWRTGRVHMFVWYVLRDPEDSNDWQSGLYLRDGRAKPAAVMFRRPISRRPVVGYGGQARLWGRSHVAPDTARLVYSRNLRTWRTVRNQQRSADGVMTGRQLMTARTWFAVEDSQGRGLARKVAVILRTLRVPSGSVRVGQRVRIRGKSFRSPRTVRLLISNDRRSWRRIPNQRRGRDGTVIATFVARRTTYVAVADRHGRSGFKRIRVRR